MNVSVGVHRGKCIGFPCGTVIQPKSQCFERNQSPHFGLTWYVRHSSSCQWQSSSWLCSESECRIGLAGRARPSKLRFPLLSLLPHSSTEQQHPIDRVSGRNEYIDWHFPLSEPLWNVRWIAVGTQWTRKYHLVRPLDPTRNFSNYNCTHRSLRGLQRYRLQSGTRWANVGRRGFWGWRRQFNTRQCNNNYYELAVNTKHRIRYGNSFLLSLSLRPESERHFSFPSGRLHPKALSHGARRDPADNHPVHQPTLRGIRVHSRWLVSVETFITAYLPGS